MRFRIVRATEAFAEPAREAAVALSTGSVAGGPATA